MTAPDDKRLASMSPNKSVILRVGDVMVRVGRRTQMLVVGKALKIAVPFVVAAVAAIFAVEC